MPDIPITRWHEQQLNIGTGAAAVMPGISPFKLTIPRGLVFRRIYLASEVRLSVPTDQYVLNASLELLDDQQVVADLPASFVQNDNGSTFTKFCGACLGSMNTSPVGLDCISVGLGQKFSGADRQLLLTPMRVNAYASSIQMNIKESRAETGSITSVRFYVGVLSSNYA